MANDIDKTSPHYKGDFGSIYEVNKKFPTGGVAGDFVVIEGWAHYWNADRATWCVNAERDSYWDELITNIIEKFKLVRGATYMGVASLDTVPAKVIGAKMYYFATVAGTYKNFGDLVVPQGINVLYSENGSSWVNTTLLEVAQELGVSTKKVVSQKALNDALNLKANQSSVNEALAKKADKEEMNRLLAKKANTADVDTKFTEEKKRVDAELDKKFDKESVVQESGEAEDKVMSQKAVSDKLSDLSNEIGGEIDWVSGYFYNTANIIGEKTVEPTMRCAKIACSQGMKFIVNAKGGNKESYRLYAFADNAGNIIRLALPSLNAVDMVLEAENGESILVLNDLDLTNTTKSYYGQVATNKISETLAKSLLFKNKSWSIAKILKYDLNGIPQIYDILWNDGVSGRVTLSLFDDNVLEYKRVSATYNAQNITYDYTFDDNGYITNEKITIK